MFSLAERLHARGEDPELYERLMDEARWGLDWVLKTSFHDGYRNAGSINSRRTNGVIGDDDDVKSRASYQPMSSFVASAAEGIAYRVLKDRDPRLAANALKMAEEDWKFGVAGIAAMKKTDQLWRVTFDSDNVAHDVASSGALASLELWRATGEQRFADKAFELARVMMDSQQRKRPEWSTPLTGFFYTGPEKDRILHYCHRGREQAPILAFTTLCELFPNHPEWMKWYSAVALHAQYLKTMAKYTAPYDVMPSSIYKDDEYVAVPESRRESFRKQVLSGVPLGAGHYLRLFPVWMDYRGHFGTILPQAQALLSAAHLRGDLGAQQLAERQLEWIIGRNPFRRARCGGKVTISLLFIQRHPVTWWVGFR
jgi:hypothetical protein